MSESDREGKGGKEAGQGLTLTNAAGRAIMAGTGSGCDAVTMSLLADTVNGVVVAVAAGTGATPVPFATPML